MTIELKYTNNGLANYSAKMFAVYIYIYIYIYNVGVCVCVCVCLSIHMHISTCECLCLLVRWCVSLSIYNIV